MVILPDCTKEKIDLVFVVETSGNMETQQNSNISIEQNFQLVKEFIIDLLKPLIIGLNDTRVGLVTFSNNIHNIFYLDTYSNKQSIIDSIEMLQHEGGYPNTADGIRMMHLRQFSESVGDRPDVPNVAILITYCASVINQELTIPYALEAQLAGITMYTVGVSFWTELALHELQSLASPPRIKGTNYFAIDGFQDLKVRVTRNLNVFGDACTPGNVYCNVAISIKQHCPVCKVMLNQLIVQTDIRLQFLLNRLTVFFCIFMQLLKLLIFHVRPKRYPIKALYLCFILKVSKYHNIS